MKYYIKIFNKATNELVGYYKTHGNTCISKLPKRIKCYDTAEEALEIANNLDNGFIRDKDKSYYLSHAIVYGDASDSVICEKEYITNSEEDKEDELKAFIRQNRY